MIKEQLPRKRRLRVAASSKFKRVSQQLAGVSSATVRDLATRVFRGDVMFDPDDALVLRNGELVMWVVTTRDYTLRELRYFCAALDRNPMKYKTRYAFPDIDHGPTSIRVAFMRNVTE